MRLITWNIQWGRGVDRRVDLARIVATARAMAEFDVICMQEVADNFPALPGNDDRDEFAELAKLLPGYACVAGYAVDRAGDGERRRRFGNAIFSRYRVISTRQHALPSPPDPGVSTMPRVAVEATLEAPIGPIRLTTTHLEYYSALQRQAQARHLRELHAEACARALRTPVRAGNGGPFDASPDTALAILCGDFNFPPVSRGYDEIQRPPGDGLPAYRDAWPIINGHQPHTPTFCVHERKYADTPYCCDFVFVSEPLIAQVRWIKVDSATQASDHQPVAVEIDDL